MTLPPFSILGPLWGLAEFLTAVKTRSRSAGPSKDRGSVFLLWAVCLSTIAIAVYAANKFPEWAMPNRRWFFIAALSLFVLGIVFRTYSILYLGRLFTPDVAIASDHPLIDSGPYRFIRHPTYTGLVMIVLGVGLSFTNVASLLIVFVPILFCLLWRIRIEEKVLAEALGEPYRSYMRRTKRLIPFIY